MLKQEQNQLIIILLIVFTGFIGTSIAYPILPPLFIHPDLGTIVPGHWHESTRSIFLGLTLAVYPLGIFIGSPILGRWSDYYGRKHILIFSLLASGIGYALTAVSLQYQSLWLLIASRFFTGITEGNLAIVRAMATDLSTISKYKSLGRVNSVSAIGYVMGPILGGILSDKSLVSWFSFSLPFYLATIFSIIAVALAATKLPERTTTKLKFEGSISEYFNLHKRFKYLFKQNLNLKNLIIISTLFTISVDIFYEFGPVYLTGLWAMTPAGIALYNAALSFTLALGAGWLPSLLSNYFSVERVVTTVMLLTAFMLGLLVIFPTPALSFALFLLLGLSISTANTNMTIQISNTAAKEIQGEAMGAQLSLRMLGDTFICLFGGLLIITSVITPIAISCLIGLGAALYSARQSRTQSNDQMPQ